MRTTNIIFTRSKRSRRIAKTEIQPRLMEIWRELFQRNDILTADSFFDLGGDSILATRLFDRIRVEFNQELPVTTLLANDTIASLAERICEHDDDTGWSSLVPLKASGQRPALFAFHAFEQVLFYRHLAAEMPADRPFYGVQSCTLNMDSIETLELEQLTATYVRDIRSVQPNGPYHLGGHCFGGYLAYEAALQLRAAGHWVQSLFIFDSNGPVPAGQPDTGVRNSTRYPPPHHRSRFNRFRFHLSNGTLPGVVYTHAHNVLLTRTRRLKKSRRRFANALFNSVGNPMRYSHVYRVNQEFVRMMVAYNARVDTGYDGAITLFRSTQAKARHIDNWRRLSPAPLRIHDVPGTHSSMFKPPHVRQLAQLLITEMEPLPRDHRHGPATAEVPLHRVRSG